MEQEEKYVRKRRRTHRRTPEDDDEFPAGPVDESAIACTKCGSLYTRPSTSGGFSFSIFTRGILYRCRTCKSHFRVRGESADLFMASVLGGVAVIALLFVVVVITEWDQFPGRVKGFLADRMPAQKVEPVKQVPLNGPRAQDSDVLSARLRDLNQTADMYDRRFPELEDSYHDMVNRYSQLLADEKKKSGESSAATVNRRMEHISADFADKLERGHSMLADLLATFNKQVDDMNAQAQKRAQICEKTKGNPGTSSDQRQECEAFAAAFASLHAKSQTVAADFNASEKVYQETRREINRISTEFTGKQILN